MASFACKEKDNVFRYNSSAAEKKEAKEFVVYLLWDDGVVVLKNEPLDVMRPETLLVH